MKREDMVKAAIQELFREVMRVRDIKKLERLLRDTPPKPPTGEAS